MATDADPAPNAETPATEARRSAFERALQLAFFWLVVRPVVLVMIGLHVRHRERLPAAGPAVVVANHNSHLDTVVLMTLLPSRLLGRVRPMAAADYFLAGRVLSWFSLRVMGILPVVRGGAGRLADPLAGAQAALDRGEIVILFPEGTRGEPERLAEFKSGVSHLARRNPQVPVVPVFLHGLGKALPKGAVIPVPFFCDVAVGEPIRCGEGPWADDRRAFLDELTRRMRDLRAEANPAEWE